MDAFCAANTARMRGLLADDLSAYITNREGGVDKVGADEYFERVVAMDLPSVQFRVGITQVVTPRPDMVLLMVEINASHGDRTLHNHASHCLFLREGLVAEVADGRGPARGKRHLLVLIADPARPAARGRRRLRAWLGQELAPNPARACRWTFPRSNGVQPRIRPAGPSACRAHA